jgi:hypothetical protein
MPKASKPPIGGGKKRTAADLRPTTGRGKSLPGTYKPPPGAEFTTTKRSPTGNSGVWRDPKTGKVVGTGRSEDSPFRKTTPKRNRY